MMSEAMADKVAAVALLAMASIGTMLVDGRGELLVGMVDLFVGTVVGAKYFGGKR